MKTIRSCTDHLYGLVKSILQPPQAIQICKTYIGRLSQVLVRDFGVSTHLRYHLIDVYMSNCVVKVFGLSTFDVFEHKSKNNGNAKQSSLGKSNTSNEIPTISLSKSNVAVLFFCCTRYCHLRSSRQMFLQS